MIIIYMGWVMVVLTYTYEHIIYSITEVETEVASDGSEAMHCTDARNTADRAERCQEND